MILKKCIGSIKGLFYIVEMTLNRPKHGIKSIESGCLNIGNLFDNAIEAVKDLPDEQRQIDFSIQNPNGIFRIEMSNPYEDERRKVEHHYLTTKKENTEMHGLGLMSVQKIVEKYDGLMEISDTDNVFKVIVIFFVRGND